MKASSILFFILFCFSVIAQEGDVQLIQPIQETEAMTVIQARSFARNQYRNWGIQKLGLDSIMMDQRGKGIKICICDTGEPDHLELSKSKGGAKNFSSDESAKDGNGHSTHVAGIIQEIAPEAKMYYAKVLGNSGGGTSRGVADGVKWCINQKVDIINLSLGSRSPSASIKKEIDKGIEKGVLVVAAVGNDGKFGNNTDVIGYPAKYEETLAVGSINDKIRVSKFSSPGKEGDIVAPGEKILSTWLNNKYIVLSGTSMATPYTSGVAALFLEKYGNSKEAEQYFEAWAKDIAPKGFDRYAFWGHVEPKDLFSNDSLITNPEPPRDTTITDPKPTEPPMDGGGFEWWEVLLMVGLIVLAIILFIYFRRS